MEMPTLRQLRTFLAVVELGSITEAARSLNITQPAASQQLREMERSLGAKLLDRADGRAIPTATGEAILESAKMACAAAMGVVTAAAAYRSGESGRVRLGTGATACIYLLPAVLTAARRHMPGLEILVATGNTSEVLRRVEDGSLDAGLVTLPRAIGRALTKETICRDDFAALIPDTTRMPPGSVSPRQLAGLPMILYERGGDTRSIVDAWFRNAGLGPKPIMELGSVEAIKVLVGSGLGASVLPSLALTGPVAGASVHTLSPVTGRELGLVMRKEKVLDRGLRVLIEALHQAE